MVAVVARRSSCDTRPAPAVRCNASHTRRGGNHPPVGLQRVGDAAEHDADVGRVLAGGVEVRVVADVCRQARLRRGDGEDGLALQRGVGAQGGVVVGVVLVRQQALQPRADVLPLLAAQRHEPVEHIRGQRRLVLGRQHALLHQRLQADDGVAHARRDEGRISGGRRRDDTKRDVGDAEVRIRRHRQPRCLGSSHDARPLRSRHFAPASLRNH